MQPKWNLLTTKKIMKTKAMGNLKVAQELINQRSPHFLNASVHCSYYAVFQYMKYMLAHTDKNPISYIEQKEECSDKSSHDYVIEQIKNRIGKPADARDFAQGVRDLKKERVDADYDRRVFKEIESIECRDKANGLITKLKTYFGNI